MSDNVASITRLVEWVQNATCDSVSHVLGQHIEMSDAPGVDYPIGANWQPKEHTLPLSLNQLLELKNALKDQTTPHWEPLDDFIIDPKDLPPLPAGGRVGGHGMYVMGTINLRAKGKQAVYLSHIPMYRGPHDYQLLLEAKLTILEATGAPCSTIFTIDPEVMSLNDLINEDISSFDATLFCGNFENGGAVLGNVTLSSLSVLSAEQLTTTPGQLPLHSLRYYALPDPTTPFSTLARQASPSGRFPIAPWTFYLDHHIRKSPDFYHLAKVVVDTGACGPAGSGIETLTPAMEWRVMGATNAPSARVKRGQTLLLDLVDDPQRTQCVATVVEDYDCLIGPDFGDFCDAA
eukprot:CAMPEP_0177643952 /NCGR_PEP_ID=MMETSP0447-20121125/8423_1 /TAXON_ID=0 /ORGANISM="Stygamoeba regulata, Strain BSH-02190019" /LENGTH=347 /DNA_ID=CAMNT_0019146269 /DNA_START=173 /DNA_END=1216 /DNA_ORIENTATION=+